MNKIKNLLIGATLGIVLTCVTCTTMSSVNKIPTSISSYYSLCDFDFIIPSPWYSQIKDIKNKDFVSSIVPYFVMKKRLTGNGKSSDVNLFFIEQSYGLQNTAYSNSLLFEGNTMSATTIVIDESTKKSLQLNIGDVISFSIGNSSFDYKVSGVSYDNKFSNYPTAIVYYEGKIKSEIEKTIENLAYSGAYVKASDISKAESYFIKDYRAMGKVGEPFWYDSMEAYSFMKESIENQSLAKEVINISQLRTIENANLVDKKKDNALILLITVVIVSISYIIVWLFYIIFAAKVYRERIKAGAKQSSIVCEYILGELTTVIIFFAGLYLIKSLDENILISVSLIIALLFSFIIVSFFTKKLIYRKKRQM